MTTATNLLAVGLAFCAATAAAVPIAGQGTWETTLKPRDINRDGVVDAYYDTSLDVTWLADANWAGTTGWEPIGGWSNYEWPVAPAGALNPSHTAEWLSALNVFGITGWRIPTTATTCIDHEGVAVCEPAYSEMRHMNGVTLGNASGKSINTGPISNLLTYHILSAGVDSCTWLYGPYPCLEYFSFSSQNFGYTDEYVFPGLVWAVHDGNVAPVPEPATYALMAIGLGALGWSARRRRTARPLNVTRVIP
jgi:hypothetical protein